MPSLSSNLSLKLYSSGSSDQSGSFLTWTQDMSGSSDSNMVKIDNWSGSASGSISTLQTNITGSMTYINNVMSSISGSMVGIMADIVALTLRFAKLAEFTGAGTADFNNISGSYTHLLLIGVASGNIVGTNMELGLDFNGDANSSHYNTLQWSNWYPSSEDISQYSSYGTIIVGSIPACSGTSDSYGSPFFAVIPNYSANGGFYKNAMGFSAFAKVSPVTNTTGVALQGGVWTSTEPITRIRVFGISSSAYRYSFWSGTKISLYGIG